MLCASAVNKFWNWLMDNGRAQVSDIKFTAVNLLTRTPKANFLHKTPKGPWSM